MKCEINKKILVDVNSLNRKTILNLIGYFKNRMIVTNV